MGIQQQTLQPVLTLTLGAIETTPLEMATVAATLASGGVRHWPNFVERITDRHGNVIYEAGNSPGERVLPADVVACTTDILQEVVQRGTGTNARLAGGRPVAGKTGTTDGRSDANFLGFSPGLAAFVWYGNPTARVPGAGFGGDVPARVFKAFMDVALEGQPMTRFPPAGPVCARPPAPRPIPGLSPPPPPPPPPEPAPTPRPPTAGSPSPPAAGPPVPTTSLTTPQVISPPPAAGR
jgi:membrane peptidoglycan carboxypeptidase